MAKKKQQPKKVKSLQAFYGNKRRFLEKSEMAIAKHEEAILNAKIKRGEIENGNYRYAYVCPALIGCIGFYEINTL